MSYNADGATGAHNRLAYIGQDLYDSGVEMGKRIARLVPKGDDRAVHRHARRS